MKLKVFFSFLMLVSLTIPCQSADTKITDKRTALDYKALMKELGKVTNSSNKLWAKRELSRYSDQLKGELFYIQAVGVIKSDPIAQDGRLSLWLEQDIGIDIRLDFDDEIMKEDFEKIEEFDFVTITAKLISLEKEMIFEVEALMSLEPYDPQVNQSSMIDYNKLLTKIEELGKDNTAFNPSGKIQVMSRQYRNKLGYIIGRVKEIGFNEADEPIILLDTGRHEIEVRFIPRYIESLEGLSAGDKISLAVRPLDLSGTQGPVFHRGSFIQLSN